ncbi:hypothetical protein EUBSIR_02040 [[Eubacterium] siraeum DSM 15702]|uniref:Uncharacterized protein n=1 Tax=[Eubacterium] siraeum DSM 15702 TaxID=428128 RepID=B0MQC4_9FIRM|nr:hypothetical protein EUBSIR_02040 [[Eubacterium] siraeum DSM 15702]
MPVPSLEAGNKPKNWTTLMVMINYMTIISKPESTYIILVEGLYGTSKKAAQSFTLTRV